MSQDVLTQVSCYHCGEECPDLSVRKDDHYFCCVGCRAVHQILVSSNLEDYYCMTEQAVGLKPDSATFEFLQNQELASTILDYEDDHQAKVTLTIPQMHCSSCIWVLEHMTQINSGIVRSRVNFLNKSCSILYNKNQTNLYDVVLGLTKIGYAPTIKLDAADISHRSVDRSLLLKLGVAGFVFGNIMLLSFPEYLGLSSIGTMTIFKYLNIILILPSLLYSANDYFKSAYRAFRHGQINIDAPIVLGMAALFFKSLYDIFFLGAEGYLDSLSGFIFFLLIAKWFQKKSHDSIQFNRDYRSFFPLSIMQKTTSGYRYVSVESLIEGDIIKVKSEEIVPCDGVLLSEEAQLNYSFVTGEEKLRKQLAGDIIYAGGKVEGGAAQLRLTKAVSQSYLTQLWNESISSKAPIGLLSLIDQIGRGFIYTILLIAIAAFIFWYPHIDQVIHVVSSILIIACPCVIALSVPFIYGNILRLLNNLGFYIRHTDVLFRLDEIDTVIFDKTGTITDLSTMIIDYEGQELTEAQKLMIKTLTAESSHPLSKALYEHLTDVGTTQVTDFKIHNGLGIAGYVRNSLVRLGSAKYIFSSESDRTSDTEVIVEIAGYYIGRFIYRQQIRNHIPQLIHSLSDQYEILMLSGDNDSDHHRMRTIFPQGSELLFEQKPIDKLNKVKELQQSGRKVLMIGDGLNDAGALKASYVGVVISDDSNQLSPACDLIIDSGQIKNFYNYLSFISHAKYLLYGAFVFAFMYNMIGLSFAFMGKLTPLVAAILMPLSSGTLLIYALISTRLLFKYYSR